MRGSSAPAAANLPSLPDALHYRGSCDSPCPCEILMKAHILTSILCLSLVTCSAAAANWPQWRGPTANGSVDDPAAPATLNPDENLLWKLQLPGLGSSTPIVWNEHIMLTCDIDGRDTVVCYDFNRKEIWRHRFGKSVQARYKTASSCNPSPITDGTCIYVYFKSGKVAALTLTGTLKWEVNLQKRYGEDTLGWDLGTSPVLADGKLVIAVLQNGGGSYLASLDCETGKEVWKIARTFDSVEESYDAYTTPIVMDVNGRETIICWAADHLSGNAADTGELLWHAGSYNPRGKHNWRVIASPVIADSVAIIPFARGRSLAGTRLGETTDPGTGGGLWQKDSIGSDVASPTSRGGLVYLLGDRGQVSCLEAASGKVHWQSQLPIERIRFFSSPVLAGDKLYCAATDGTLFCGTVTKDGLKDITTGRIPGSIAASPVVVDGRVLIRNHTTLFCFGDKPGQ